MNNLLKLLQRRLYSFLNTWMGCSLAIVGFFVTVNMLIRGGQTECGFSYRGMIGLGGNCWRDHFTDNIGHVNVRASLAYDPIDAVYTWVNGSDPRWIERMLSWRARLDPISISAPGSNSTGNATDNDKHSLNRYRDSNELKYSLRSLEIYAPWLRKIFIVTDNQVPSWLNTRNARVQLVSHSDIFLNKSDLPVFSSPAIEAHLHRIPGLSKKFIYFNDDVMLGKAVLPEDFTSVSGVQKFHFAWDVPKCAPGCSDNWIGDGYCDKACNVSSCNFDFPDCVNVSSTAAKNTRHETGRHHTAMCSKGCPDTWVADKTCDNKCKTTECGWDLGDCGLDLMAESLPHVQLSMRHVLFKSSNEAKLFPHLSQTDNLTGSDNTAVTRETSDCDHGSGVNETVFCQSEQYQQHEEHAREAPVVLTVLNGTAAVYFNLSFLPCHARFQPMVDCKRNFSYTSAKYSSDDGLVHHAVLLNKHDTLGVLLFHGQDGTPTPPVLPAEAEFVVTGVNSLTTIEVEIKFRLRVIDVDDDAVTAAEVAGIPTGLNPVTGRCTACPEASDLDDFAYAHGNPILHAEIIRYPLKSHEGPLSLKWKSNETDEEQYVAAGAHVTINPHLLDRVHFSDPSSSNLKIGDEPLSNIVIRQTASSPNMPIVEAVLPLCSALGLLKHSDDDKAANGWLRYMFSRSSHEHSDICYNFTMREFLKASTNMESLPNLKTDRKYPNLVYSSDLSHELDGVRAVEHDTSLLLLLYLPAAFSLNRPVLMHNQSNENETNVVKTPGHRWFQVKTEFFLFHDALDANQDSPTKSLGKAKTGIKFSPAVEKLFKFGAEKTKQTSSIFSGNPIGSQDTKGIKFACMLSNVRWKYPVDKEPDYLIMTDINSNDTDGFQVHRRLTSAFSTGKEPILRDAVITDETDVKFSQIAASKRILFSSDSHKLPETNRKRRMVKNGDTLKSEDKIEYMTSVVRKILAGYDEDRVVYMATSKPQEENSFIASLSRFVFSEASRLLLMITAIFGDSSSHSPRRLTDTYGQSLIHVNRLYHKAFGSENRKVPAHLPHMIDKNVMGELQDMFKEQWIATSSHKFRSPEDMQYAFSYYYYVMNRNKAKPPSLFEYVSREVDTNRDGVLDDNEFLTLASLVAGRSPKDIEMNRYYDCVFRRGNYSTLTHVYNETGQRSLHDNEKSLNKEQVDGLIGRKISQRALKKIEKIASSRSQSNVVRNDDKRLPESLMSSSTEIPGGIIEKKSAFIRFPSVDEVLGCPEIVTELRDRVAWPVTYTTGNEKDIAFEMIGDNFTESYSQLNSIRARRPKFICVNDNMKEPSREMIQAFEDFFRALYPHPSQFELPEGQRNPTLYTDELQSLNASWTAHFKLFYLSVLILISSFFSRLHLSVLYLLKSLVQLLDGDDDSTGLYVLFRMFSPVGERAVKTEKYSVWGPITTADHGYDLDDKGSLIHTFSVAVPFSFLILSVAAVLVVIFMYCRLSFKRIKRSADTHSSGPISIEHVGSTDVITADDLARIDGVTAPKLAVAAILEKSSASSSFPNKNLSNRRQLSSDDDEDFLNKLWRKAGYGSGNEVGGNENVETSPDAQSSSWEDREFFTGEAQEHQDSNESGHSPGADSDIKDYEHGILKRDGYSSSNKKKSVRWDKKHELEINDANARPRGTGISGLQNRLYSALQTVTGKGAQPAIKDLADSKIGTKKHEE